MSAIKDPGILDREIRNKYRGLLRVAKPLIKQEDTRIIRKALNISIDVCSNLQTITGKPYVLHVISVARIVAEEIGLGTTSIIASLLSDAVNKKGYSPERIKNELGNHVLLVLEGLSKISGINTEKTHLQDENFRKLLLNLASDVRVILIKLAERLEYMRNMETIRRDAQLRLASETYFLYAPLAHRLGLFNIKSELEDLSMKYTEPKRYQIISRKLKDTTARRNRFIREFSDPLKKVLSSAGFEFEIIGRPKSIHSIWMKMKKQNIEFEEVYDTFAIRIILESSFEREKADCWQVYSFVTDLYQPNPQRLRDWISIPKTNGYESLHTTVVGPGGIWVEVQIRTVRMNEIAEKGYAAHWKYKGMKPEKGIEDWLIRMREILEMQEDDIPDFIDQIRPNLYSEEVFVFTPKGDLKQLPAGATVLDFAFDVHSDIGSTCVGGKVNNRNVSIRHVLENGDQVVILTAKNQKPKTDWLTFVVTSKARTKIKQALNKEKFSQAEAGKELLKRRFRNWKIRFNDENVKKLLKYYDLKTSQELYYLIYIEKIDLAELKGLLTRGKEKEQGKEEEIRETSPGNKTVHRDTMYDDYLVIDRKVENLDYKLAKCCNPIFGDDIFGFVTINEGIKIHRVNCPNSPQLMAKYPYRVIDTKWTHSDGSSTFQTIIKLQGIDEVGIVNQISEVISKDLKVIMRSITVEPDDGMFEGILKVFVSDTKHLEALLRKLLRIKGVLKAVRYDDASRG
ncbi:MAG: bifunctional (p)ppGpp synthetase/guanosine-3',5'-bis(diphosphate) 3'-pyrophosphohydrolase [Bacteroidales bacterium]|nr:MAG: bifunctional (p)ppGpp synthetase/guanosine-3',5'-bis(diphosphate) 3'-pyrophosphohydrolase [Bacteroidales bacterium]